MGASHCTVPPRPEQSHALAKNVLSVTKITHSDDTHRHDRLVNCKCYTSEPGHRAISRALPRKVFGMRRTVVLMASMALTVLLASGVALALNTIRCDGGKCNGTPKADKMMGTGGRDIIYGLKGDDALFGRPGRDDLYGFEGGDIAYGGAGSDKLFGGDGRDDLNGEADSDSLNGGDSWDYLDGGGGNDSVFGGRDGASDSIVTYGGYGGRDLLNGAGGADWYSFESVYATPNAGWGHVTISDSDTNPAPGQGVSSGDELSFPRWYWPLTITLSPGSGPEVSDAKTSSTIQWSGAGEIHKVTGTGGDDTIIGDQWANRLLGAQGANTIEGRAGDDVVRSSGNGGSQSGGDGNDTLSGFRGATLRGGNGNDLISAGSPSGSTSAPTSDVGGGAGNDEIEAQNGSPDIIDCGEGTDTVTYDAADTVTNCEDASTS